jgi:molybdate transport system ATP-binding protein
MPGETLEVNIAVDTRGFGLDVSFSVPPGITILFGPSGAGKSTTLAAIAGLVKPSRGRITLGGETWFDSAKHVDVAVHRRGVAFVFQSLALFPHLSALDNVSYGISRKIPRADRKKRALEMLDRMRVPHLAARRPRTFSGGEAQRVALARALAMSPRIVLLDEAFSAMDRDLRAGLLQDVRAYVEEVYLPVIQVTHHRMEARAMGDRIVLMEAGKVKAAGTIRELLPESIVGRGGFEQLDRTPIPELDRGGSR